MAETQKTVTDPAAAAAEPVAAQAAATESAVKTEAAAGADPAVKTEPAAKTYDQAYIESLLERQKQDREAAVAEALKVAGMDAEAKASYEKEQAAKKLAEREAEVARRELKADARGLLAEKYRFAENPPSKFPKNCRSLSPQIKKKEQIKRRYICTLPAPFLAVLL